MAGIFWVEESSDMLEFLVTWDNGIETDSLMINLGLELKSLKMPMLSLEFDLIQFSITLIYSVFSNFIIVRLLSLYYIQLLSLYYIQATPTLLHSGYSHISLYYIQATLTIIYSG